MLNELSKMIATAKIVDPIEVKQQAMSDGGEYHPGAIYCTVPELGQMPSDLIYCRYGLSLPFFKIQKDQLVLIEPTIKPYDRFFFTGIVDAGMLELTDADQMIMQFKTQGIYASTEGVISLSSKEAEEPFVNGTKLSEWAKTVDDALKALIEWSATGIPPGPAGGIKPPAPPPVASKFEDTILSKKIMGE